VTGRDYLALAITALEDQADSMSPNVAACNAVLAGIAAADAISCVRLNKVHRGADHKGATALLEEATPDGKALATTFGRLVGMKDSSHYGSSIVSRSSSENAIKWAKRLVERAGEEVER
jgi:hypothetical protein